MKVLAILKLKFATLEKPCKDYAEALLYIKNYPEKVDSYEIKPIGSF